MNSNQSRVIQLKFTLIRKWGFDESTGHSEYKRKLSNNDLEDKSFICYIIRTSPTNFKR